MSYTAYSIRDSIGIRIVTPDSIRIRSERKRPIRRSLKFRTGFFSIRAARVNLIVSDGLDSSIHVSEHK